MVSIRFTPTPKTIIFPSFLYRTAQKGLHIALQVAKKTGIELRIAAADGDPRAKREFEEMCRARGVVPVGEVRGKQKAEVFAGARALLFPSQWNEIFGLVLAEALMSGTPVIGSDKGAIPELMESQVGFICRHETNYIDAISNIDRIDPKACRALAAIITCEWPGTTSENVKRRSEIVMRISHPRARRWMTIQP